MIITACVETLLHIDTVASLVRKATGAQVQVLRNLHVLVISASDDVNQDEILEKIRRINGIKTAVLDGEVRLIE